MRGNLISGNTNDWGQPDEEIQFTELLQPVGLLSVYTRGAHGGIKPELLPPAMAVEVSPARPLVAYVGVQAMESEAGGKHAVLTYKPLASPVARIARYGGAHCKITGKGASAYALPADKLFAGVGLTYGWVRGGGAAKDVLIAPPWPANGKSGVCLVAISGPNGAPGTVEVTWKGGTADRSYKLGLRLDSVWLSTKPTGGIREAYAGAEKYHNDAKTIGGAAVDVGLTAFQHRYPNLQIDVAAVTGDSAAFVVSSAALDASHKVLSARVGGDVVARGVADGGRPTSFALLTLATAEGWTGEAFDGTITFTADAVAGAGQAVTIGTGADALPRFSGDDAHSFHYDCTALKVDPNYTAHAAPAGADGSYPTLYLAGRTELGSSTVARLVPDVGTSFANHDWADLGLAVHTGTVDGREYHYVAYQVQVKPTTRGVEALVGTMKPDGTLCFDMDTGAINNNCEGAQNMQSAKALKLNEQGERYSVPGEFWALSAADAAAVGPHLSEELLRPVIAINAARYEHTEWLATAQFSVQVTFEAAGGSSQGIVSPLRALVATMIRGAIGLTKVM